jgi:hypothetical protein
LRRHPEHLDLEVTLDNDAFESAIFGLQSLQSLRIRHVHRAEALAPAYSVAALTPCFLATSTSGSLSASQRLRIPAIVNAAIGSS